MIGIKRAATCSSYLLMVISQLFSPYTVIYIRVNESSTFYYFQASLVRDIAISISVISQYRT